jgi:hypothetical protein
MNDVELASWFVTSNAWLEERTPAEAIETQLEAVQLHERAPHLVAETERVSRWVE